jgi:hypothetical protein
VVGADVGGSCSGGACCCAGAAGGGLLLLLLLLRRCFELKMPMLRAFLFYGARKWERAGC